MPLVVNNEIVDPSLIDQEFSSIKSYYESLAQVSCCERDGEFLGYAKENLVKRILLAQESERRKYPVLKKEVDREIARLKSEHTGEWKISPEAEKLLRQDLAARLRMEKFIADVAGTEPNPSEEEMRAWQEEHRADYTTEEEIRALHIFKSFRNSEGREALYKTMREIRAAAVAGEDFHALALKHTDKEPEDIDLGFFHRGEHMEEFEIIAFSMNVGEVSPVFASHWGFHLCKLTDRKPATLRPFEELRDAIRQTMIQEHRKARLEELAQELRVSAVVSDNAEPELVASHAH